MANDRAGSIGAAVWVWAPNARKEVEVIVSGRRFPMDPGDGGWWSASPPGWGPGTEYAFSIDGGEALPDPRSRRQPRGVHGPSQVVDLGDFDWKHRGFRAPPLSSAVIYELHIGTFSPEGTCDGAIARLDHLVKLGITHVELMPVAQFPGTRGWGYDGVNPFAVHEPYGGPHGLQRFVDACHGKGLGVLLDVVYNHLGPEGNRLAAFGPYFTDTYGTPWGEAVNLDGPGSDEVRRFFIQNALMWLRDYRIDGLRIDAVHAFFDRSAVHFLEEIARAVRSLEASVGRPLTLVAESDLNDPRVIAPVEAGGYGIDAQWSDDFHHALHSLLTGERDGYYADFGALTHLAEALEHGFVYAGRYSRHRGRRHGRPIRDLRGRRLLGYIQNHDQVGNRAVGDRISALVSPERVRIASAMVLTSPFVPLLFQGEEWGASSPFQYFTDLVDPELGRAVSEGRRREFEDFGWSAHEVPDPQDERTHARSVLDWGERGRHPHRDILAWYRELIQLRRSHPALAEERMPAVRVDPDRGRLEMVRGTLTVAVNIGTRPWRMPFGEGGSVPPEILLAFPTGVTIDGSALELPPESVAVVEHGGPDREQRAPD